MHAADRPRSFQFFRWMAMIPPRIANAVRRRRRRPGARRGQIPAVMFWIAAISERLTLREDEIRASPFRAAGNDEEAPPMIGRPDLGTDLRPRLREGLLRRSEHDAGDLAANALLSSPSSTHRHSRSWAESWPSSGRTGSSRSSAASHPCSTLGPPDRQFIGLAVSSRSITHAETSSARS